MSTFKKHSCAHLLNDITETEELSEPELTDCVDSTDTFTSRIFQVFPVLPGAKW